MKGTDDWRNGLPLCATHHDAFDNHFFAIDPSTGAIQCKPGVNAADIGVEQTKLQCLHNAPHIDALKWRWDATQREWKQRGGAVMRDG
jgi:hypothetical protein